MQRLTIDLPDTAAKALLAAAERERRHPRDQAAIYVERALRRGPRSPVPGTVAHEPVLTIARAAEGA